MTGQTIAHYEVLEMLGTDRTGDYYRAQERTLGQEVLVRILRRELGHDQDAFERFSRIAKAAASLNHPNISGVLEIGHGPSGTLLPDSRVFIVTRFEGQRWEEDLATVTSGSVEKAIEIARQIAEALSAAHEFGIIHGALRQTCVAVTGSRQVIVRDFGMSALLESESFSLLSDSEALPPETRRGEPATRQTDLWSLGSILYKLIEGSSPTATTVRPDMPAHVSPQLADLLDHLLEPDPRYRPSSARAVIDALNDVPEASEASSRAVFVLPQGRGWSRMLLGSVLAFAAAIFIWFALQPAIPVSERVLAVAPFHVDPGDSLDFLSQGLAEGLALSFDSADGWRTVDVDAAVGFFEGSVFDDRGMASALGREFSPGRVITGSVSRVAEGYELAGSVWKADGNLDFEFSIVAPGNSDVPDILNLVADELAAALDIDEWTPADRFLSDSDAAVKNYFEGMAALREGNVREAEQELELAVEVDRSFGLAWSGLSRVSQLQGDASELDEALDRAISESAELPPRIRTLTKARDLAFRQGQPEQARRLYSSVLAGDSTSVAAWSELGDTFMRYNPHRGLSEKEAVPYFEKSLVYLPDQPNVQQRLYGIALDEGLRAKADSIAALIDSTDSHDPVSMFTSLATSDEDMDKAEAFLIAANDAGSFSQFIPGSATYLRSLIAAAEGRLEDHDRLTWEAGDEYRGARLVSQVLLRAHDTYPAPEVELDELRARVNQWDTSAYPVQMLDEVDIFAGRYGVLKPFLLSLIELRAGDITAYRQSREALDRLAHDTGGRFAQSLLHTLEAVEAYRNDAFGSTLEALDEAHLATNWSDMTRSQIYDQSLNRYIRSATLLRLGRTEESLQVARSLTASGYIWGLTYLGPLRLQEARALALDENYEAAVDAYDRFIALWTDCDPSVKSLVEIAQLEKLEILSR